MATPSLASVVLPPNGPTGRYFRIFPLRFGKQTRQICRADFGINQEFRRQCPSRRLSESLFLFTNLPLNLGDLGFRCLNLRSQRPTSSASSAESGSPFIRRRSTPRTSARAWARIAESWFARVIAVTARLRFASWLILIVLSALRTARWHSSTDTRPVRLRRRRRTHSRSRILKGV